MKSKNISKFDEKDYLILKLLTLDTMVSLKDISKQVGLTPPSVSARIKKLRGMGIFDPTIHIAFEKFGLRRYTLGLTLRTGIPPDSRAKIIERFLDEPAVISIWTASGEHDLVFHVVFSSSYELMKFIDQKVRPISEIASMDVSEILDAIKRDGKNVRTNGIKDIPIPFSSRSDRHSLK